MTEIFENIDEDKLNVTVIIDDYKLNDTYPENIYKVKPYQIVGWL